MLDVRDLSLRLTLALACSSPALFAGPLTQDGEADTRQESPPQDPPQEQEQQETGPDPVGDTEGQDATPAVEPGSKILGVDDYGRWNSVGAVAVAPDGTWVSHSVRPSEGDATLTLQKLGSETKRVVERGSRVVFSDDSHWAAVQIAPPFKKGAARAGRGGPGGGDDAGARGSWTLIHLADDVRTEFENASAAEFAPGSKFLAVRKSGASDRLVHRLSDGRTRNLGNVDAHAFDEEGRYLAFVVKAADDHGNGVQLLHLADDRLEVLASSRETYSQLTWSEDGHHLAWLAGKVPDGSPKPAESGETPKAETAPESDTTPKTEKPPSDQESSTTQNPQSSGKAKHSEKMEQRANRAFVLREVGRPGQVLVEYDPAQHADFPADTVISELRGLSFSEDGSMLFVGLKAQRPEWKKDEDEAPEVDVWHWEDDPVQSIQGRRAGRERNRTDLAVLHLNGSRLVPLGDERVRQVSIVGKGRWALGQDATPYRGEVTWGGSRSDWMRIDLNTGARTPITEALGRPMGTSPDGRWFLFLKGQRIWVHDLDQGSTRDLSASAPVDFVNRDDDHPYELPAYGVAGWTKAGEVVLNHQHDLWVLALDGSGARCLTHGVGEDQKVRFRVVDLDPDEDHLDLGQPLLLSAQGTWSKKTGFAHLAPGAAPEMRVFEDRSHGRLTKAEKADTVVLTRQTFVDFPDYWATDLNFAEWTRISEANPQQAEYAWGSRRLIEYRNERGRTLQATVTLPAHYVEGQSYPTLVYFYERMSDRHHSYSTPRFDDRPQMSTYASDGYLVIMPDVVYEPGRPGSCAVDCVGAAVRRAIELGLADPEHIALQGHSWGGYQSSYILTQTDLFCCVVTGAPVTNLISFYGELYKSSGSIQQGIVEVGQVRMGTTPFENLELYRSQSPWHQAAKIATPFIILHGTDDGAVDWHQGLEFYAAARRLGKEVVLLSYPGEGHHLARKPNQIDFQIRMKQFFDHHCKGAEAPKWWTDGVPYIERERTPARPPKPVPMGEPMRAGGGSGGR